MFLKPNYHTLMPMGHTEMRSEPWEGGGGGEEGERDFSFCPLNMVVSPLQCSPGCHCLTLTSSKDLLEFPVCATYTEKEPKFLKLTNMNQAIQRHEGDVARQVFVTLFSQLEKWHPYKL